MADPAFTIRVVEPDECERLGDLTADAYRRVGETDEPYYAELRDVAGRAALVPVFIAVDPAGRVLGGVTYVPGPGPFNEGQAGDEGGIRMLAVAAGVTGRGIGRALVEACIARARADGRHGIALHTRPFMHGAHRLYERLGFQRDATLDWAFAPGEWLWGYRIRW